MHIADGVLSTPVLIAGAAASAVGVGYGLYRMKPEEAPKTAVMSAAFFVVSLIHLPVPPASAHLMLTGLMGIMLGWSVFPAVLLALLLQCMLFMHGGLSALGVNLICMAGPAVACHYLFRRFLERAAGSLLTVAGFTVGSATILASSMLEALALYASHEDLLPAIVALLAANLAIAVVEGCVTAAAVSFLVRVRPEVLGPSFGARSVDVSSATTPEIT